MRCASVLGRFSFLSMMLAHWITILFSRLRIIKSQILFLFIVQAETTHGYYCAKTEGEVQGVIDSLNIYIITFKSVCQSVCVQLHRSCGIYCQKVRARKRVAPTNIRLLDVIRPLTTSRASICTIWSFKCTRCSTSFQCKISGV